MKGKTIFLVMIIFLFQFSQTQSNIIGKNCTTKTAQKDCGLELICSSLINTCQYCNLTTSSACQGYPSNICYEKRRGRNLCLHKGIFPNVSVYDVLTTVFIFLGSMAASTSGIGGGGLFVPCFLFIGSFSPQLSIALSKVTIFGGSIANWLMYGRQKHPLANRPLINYDLALLIEPVILAGTIIGVFLAVMFPYWLITLLLFFILSIATYKSVKKGIKKYKEEGKAASQKIEDQSIEEELKEQFKEQDHKKTEPSVEESENESVEEGIENPSTELKEVNIDEDLSANDFKHEEDSKTENEKQLEAIEKQESKRFPILKVMGLFAVWIIIFTSSLLKGGHGVESIIPDLQPCGILYWLIAATPIPILFSVTILWGLFLRLRYMKKLKVGYKFKKGDITWSTKNAFVVPFICLLAGIFAGLLGIGGGMITSPILLELGILTRVTTSTSAYMIFFTASSTTIQFAILGILPWDYGLWFCGIGLIASLLGQVIVEHIVKKYNKTSWIILILAGLMVVSTILLVAIGIWKVYGDIQTGTGLGFKLPC